MINDQDSSILYNSAAHPASFH